MARITISLPDVLKAQLDAHATDQQISVSELVQHALTQYFAPQPSNAPAPATENPELAQRLEALEKYVAALAYESEAVRQGLYGVSAYFQRQLFLQIPCPPAISPPDWKHTPPSWMHFQ
jgi:hypothetical protein